MHATRDTNLVMLRTRGWRARDARRYASSFNVTMKVRVEADEWSPDGRKILSEENLATIRKTLEDEGPIILEHWHYYGSRSPDRIIFDDLDDFMEYVRGAAGIG